MAQLSINASDIVAAIRDSSLEFSANGLSLTNGDLTIYDYTYSVDTSVTGANFAKGEYYVLETGKNDTYVRATSFTPGTTYYTRNRTMVFGLDGTSGNLSITGAIHATSGSFTGEINATSGSFSGTIEAGGGHIGGFKIENSQLISQNGKIQLKGGEGKIIATDIDLGAGARVTDQIVFHSQDDDMATFVLYNPLLEKHRFAHPSGIDVGGKVLSAANVTMTNRGYLLLGTLELFGGTGNGDGYIRSFSVDQNSQTQDGWWRINENGTSHFESIYANNAHLRNTIMEQKTLQSVGSTMIFKESWTIATSRLTETSYIDYYRLDGLANLSKDDYVMIEDRVYKIKNSKNVSTSDQYIEIKGLAEKDFNPDVLFVCIDGRNQIYKHPTSFESGQTYYKLVLAAGNYTYIQLYAANDQHYFTKGAIITKIGTANSRDNFMQAEETTRVPGRQYYQYNNSTGTYELYEDNDLISGLYYLTATQSTDCVIAIQGSADSWLNGVGAIAAPQALSFSSFYNIGSDASPQLAFTKHLVLGKFQNTGIDALTGFSGYGLYADHVFLNGTLTTKDTDTYAGINTRSNISFTKGAEAGDTSNIIFWGGAEGTQDSFVQEAPFQVSQAGTLYAQNAVIDNSVFVGGTINAATIRTAKLYGSAETGEAALTIYDANTGIAFKSINQEDSTETEVFAIGQNGFSQGGTYFLTTNGVQPEFCGYLKSEALGNVGFQIGVYDSHLCFARKNGAVQPFGYIAPNAQNGEKKINIGFSEKYVPTENGTDAGVALSIRQERIFNQVPVYFNNTTYYGQTADGIYQMEFKQRPDGYDIIIKG